MAIDLRPTHTLEPVKWPTGEEVIVRRPNTYAAKVWDGVSAAQERGDTEAMREGMIAFAVLVCRGKTEAQIREECDDEFLLLLGAYVNDRLQQAVKIVEELSGKAAGATAPLPAMPTGTSPAGLPVGPGVPCGM